MENISSYFYFALFTIVFLFVGGVILYKWYFAQKYTRERFAFYSIWLFSGFLLSLIGLLLVRNQVLDLIVAVLNEGGAKITEYGQVDFFPTAGFILLCAGMFYFLIRNMHQNWNGVPSTRQVDLAETNRRVSLLEDFQFYRTKRDQIEIYRTREKSKPEVFSPYEPDNRPWHLKAANLFSLLDQQYHINVEKDWYREQECFISRYGQDEAKIGILCLDKRPSDERLRDFFDFVDKRGGNFEKLIVAIDGQGPEGSGVKMGREIQTRFESELLDKLISLRHYKDFIVDYFEENVLENSELTIADMYVPLGGHMVKIENGKLNRDEVLESAEAYILNWAKDKKRLQNEQLAILGEYGQGKTVLMHKIVYEMLQNPEQYPRIPILIELRGLSPRNDNEFGIFGLWANRFKAKAEALWELHRAGKLLLILDSFDQMDSIDDTEILFNNFSQLWALARVPNAQIIIAGRPNLFSNSEQLCVTLGIQNPRTFLPYTQAIYLDKLRTKQIREALRSINPEIQKEILDQLQDAGENSSFAEIISRPTTLFNLSTIWDSRLAKHQGRLNSAIIIGTFINKAYEDQESKGNMVLTSFERNYFMTGIAVGMMLENGYTNQVKHLDLQKMVERLWAYYPPKLPPYADPMQGYRVLVFLPDRMKDNSNALETILKDVRAGGILVQDTLGKDVFKFSHKVYLEYLISSFLVIFNLKHTEDRASQMMMNAIGKAYRFSKAKLKKSTGVEAFTSELIENLVQKGNIIIQESLSQIEKTGADLILEAKLILIGDGRSGKTSLANRLLGRPLPKEADRTQGVDIVIGDYSFPVLEGRQFKLHIWDFAGQDKYKPLHQFFYTEGAVYILVADSGSTTTDYDDWLQTAQLFGEGSPLLVALNEFHEGIGHGSFDSEYWQKRFPLLIKGHYLVNLLSRKNIEQLTNAIQLYAQTIPHTQVPYPKNWAAIRQELERRRNENFISWGEYLKICNQYDLPEKESALILSSVLHKIGVCLHYGQSEILRQHVILKNEWATDAVYKIMEDQRIAHEKKGFFDWEDLKRIWSDEEYNEMQPQLLELMQHFKMAYPLPNTKAYIAPPLLPPAPPNNWAFPLGESLCFFFEYEFLPKALMSQLIVSRHTDIDESRTLVWRNGVVFRWPDALAEVVKTKSQGRDAFGIRVQGFNRKGLLTAILKTLRDLHSNYKGIKVSEVVPCPCEGCRTAKNKQHYFDFDNLKNRIEKGRSIVECDKSLEVVELLELLGDLLIFDNLRVGEPLVIKNAHTNPIPNIANKTPMAFFSYSEQDSEYLEEFQKQLIPLVRSGKISLWDNRKISPGADRDKEIKHALTSADIVFLLLSSDFLAKDHIWDKEMTEAMHRHESGSAKVIPIKVRACSYEDTPFSKLQSLPRNHTAISAAPDRDSAWMGVLEEIKQLLSDWVEK